MKDSFSPFEAVPAYSEQPVPNPPLYQTASSPFSSLLHSVSQTRTSNIRAVIATHIHPHLHNSALAGLSKTTLLLIPSNISSLQPRPFSPANGSPSIEEADSQVPDSFPGESIIGFGSAENLSLKRLRGAENTLEFWRQEAVIRELNTQLKAELRNAGYHVVGDIKPGPHHPPEAWRNPAAAAAASATAKREAPVPPSRKNSFRDAEWKFTKAEEVGSGEVEAGAETQEICLRVENEMGLFETRNGKAIVVRVEFGG